jgi:methylglutaconyl-CoA hydratase
LKWIHSLLGEASDENVKELENFAELLQALQSCSKATIAGVQGSCFGGGLGLLACCDIAIAGDRARFGLPELRLGLVPFIISDCVTAAIGIRQFRRLGLTGETIGGDEALHIGLIHHLVPDAKLDAFILEQAQCALMTAPTAMARFKQIHHQHQSHANAHSAAKNLIDLLQHSAEAREGISAFLEKRRASWQA